MRHWLSALLLSSSLALAADPWVVFEACGRGDLGLEVTEFDVPFEPAPGLDTFLVRREDVSALMAPKRKSELKCTYIILNNGQSLLVIGSPEHVQRLITGETEPMEKGQ